jgi:large subunit ribosomal protein L4
MALSAKLISTDGKELGKLELNENIFGRKVSKTFLHEYVTVYMANQRQFDANTKTKAEVSGSGKKPWKQKGTGRARAGSTRSPLWRHGGVTFGPRSRDVSYGFPRRKSRLALAQALSAKQADGGLIFVDSLTVKEAKTKNVAAYLKKLGCEGKTMFVLDAPDAKLTQASRNIPGLEVLLAGDLNAYNVLRAKKVVLTRPALEKLDARVN